MAPARRRPKYRRLIAGRVHHSRRSASADWPRFRPEGCQIAFLWRVILQQVAHHALDFGTRFPGSTTAGFIIQARRAFPVIALDPKADSHPAGAEKCGDLRHAVMLDREQHQMSPLTDPANFLSAHARELVKLFFAWLSGVDHGTPPRPAYQISCKSARNFLLPT